MTLNVPSDSLAQITGGTASGKFGGGGGMTPGNDGQILVTTAGQPTWTTPDYVANPDLTTTLGTYVTKTELGTELAPLVSGMQHGASVLDFANAPDANAASGSFYVVGATPTGDFTGHAGAVAFLEGTTWKFTAPQKNEAHLNEKDNTIYHWSGTAWNKVGTVSPLILDNLTDVDTTTKAPKAGDMLVFDGKTWVPKGLGIFKSVTKGFNPRISAGACNVELAYDDFQAVDLQALIELADNPAHLSFQLVDAGNNPVLAKASCVRAAQRLAWGSDHNHDARLITYKQDSYFPDDNSFGITWLPRNNGGNDRMKASDYALIRLSICRSYDDYLIIDGSMFYPSQGGEGYDMQFKYAVQGAGVSKVKQIRFQTHSGNTRIAVNGQYTMTSHA